jgi:hypothetical protein
VDDGSRLRPYVRVSRVLALQHGAQHRGGTRSETKHLEGIRPQPFLDGAFFSTWIGHGISQWQRYTDEQQEHRQEASIGDFLSDFGASTLENWQSEFLQLFSFVTLAALFIHKGSAESKDGDDKMEASLRRIEEKLGTLPDNAPKSKSESWKLPESPDLSS